MSSGPLRLYFFLINSILSLCSWAAASVDPCEERRRRDVYGCFWPLDCLVALAFGAARGSCFDGVPGVAPLRQPFLLRDVRPLSVWPLYWLECFAELLTLPSPPHR